ALEKIKDVLEPPLPLPTFPTPPPMTLRDVVAHLLQSSGMPRWIGEPYKEPQAGPKTVPGDTGKQPARRAWGGPPPVPGREVAERPAPIFCLFSRSETPSCNRNRPRCYPAPAGGYGRRCLVRAARRRLRSLRSQREHVAAFGFQAWT